MPMVVSQALDVMPLPKIFTPDIAARSSYSLDETGDVFFTGGVAGGYGILALPGIFTGISPGPAQQPLAGVVPPENQPHRCAEATISYESRFIRHLPIRPIDFSDPTDRERHDRMVALVEEMLALHRQLAAARTDHEQTSLKRQIDATDRRIDRLVYELYNLTEEEIRIVEKG